MNTKSVITFLLAVTLFACQKADMTNSATGKGETPFTNYTLEGTTCQWTNLNYDGTVIIIRTKNEMENHINCTAGTYPEIDFANKTLLLANGEACKGITDITAKKLMQLAQKHYEFEVEIILSEENVTEQWTKAIVIDKIDGANTVDLKIEKFPLEIPFEDYNFRLWKYDIFYPSRMLIINNNIDLEDAMLCNENYPPIDFTKHTLLLYYTYSDYGILDISKTLHRLTADCYEIHAKITINNAFNGRRRIIAIIADKINNEANIEFKITTSVDTTEQNFLNLELGTYVLVGHCCNNDISMMKINFIDREILKIIYPKTYEEPFFEEFTYEINGYFMMRTNMDGTIVVPDYFRIINSRKFEIEDIFTPQKAHLPPYYDNIFFEK